MSLRFYLQSNYRDKTAVKSGLHGTLFAIFASKQFSVHPDTLCIKLSAIAEKAPVL